LTTFSWHSVQKKEIDAFTKKSEKFLRRQEKTLLDSESQQQQYQEFRRNFNMLDEDKIANLKEQLIKQPNRLSKSKNNNFYKWYKLEKIAELSDDSIIRKGKSIRDSLKLDIKIKN